MGEWVGGCFESFAGDIGANKEEFERFLTLKFTKFHLKKKNNHIIYGTILVGTIGTYEF